MDHKYNIDAAYYTFDGAGVYDKFIQTNWFIVYLLHILWMTFKGYEIIDIRIRRSKNG